jgi:hypothetical protein
MFEIATGKSSCLQWLMPRRRKELAKSSVSEEGNTANVPASNACLASA